MPTGARNGRTSSTGSARIPLQERGGKTVFRYSEKGMAWWGDNTLGIQHIFPSGAIGLDSDPKLLEICHNTIDAMDRWADYNGFSSWYTACARVGYDPKVILAKMRAECDKHSFPNLLLYYGGGGIESCGGFLAINEMLLQSHEGVMRFFPCWPKEPGRPLRQRCAPSARSRLRRAEERRRDRREDRQREGPRTAPCRTRGRAGRCVLAGRETLGGGAQFAIKNRTGEMIAGLHLSECGGSAQRQCVLDARRPVRPTGRPRGIWPSSRSSRRHWPPQVASPAARPAARRLAALRSPMPTWRMSMSIRSTPIETDRQGRPVYRGALGEQVACGEYGHALLRRRWRNAEGAGKLRARQTSISRRRAEVDSSVRRCDLFVSARSAVR